MLGWGGGGEMCVCVCFQKRGGVGAIRFILWLDLCPPLSESPPHVPPTSPKSPCPPTHFSDQRVRSPNATPPPSSPVSRPFIYIFFFLIRLSPSDDLNCSVIQLVFPADLSHPHPGVCLYRSPAGPAPPETHTHTHTLGLLWTAGPMTSLHSRSSLSG